MSESYTINQFLAVSNCHAPSVSPDGTALVYLSNESGFDQIYYHNLESGEVEQLTNLDDSVEFVEFNPHDNDLVAFGSSIGGSEKTQIFLLQIKSRTVIPVTQQPETSHHWGGWSKDGSRIAYSSNVRNGTDFDIFSHDIRTGRTTLLFAQGGWCDSEGFSPGGRWLVTLKAHTNTLYQLFLVDTSSAQPPLELTSIAELARYGHVEWRGDEAGFYFVSNFGTDLKTVRYFDLATKSTSELLSFHSEVESIALTSDNTHIAVMLNVDGYSSLQLFSLDTSAPSGPRLQLPGVAASMTFTPDNVSLVFDLSDHRHSAGVCRWIPGDESVEYLVKSGSEVPETVFVKPELFKYRSFDGLEVPSFIYKSQHEDSAASPAVVYIHGGPEGQFRPAFAPLIQFFAYSGYTVFAPNVRGSDGYGKNYMALDDVGKRMDSVSDLAGLHAYIKDYQLADNTKIALYGGSYGGYMVLAGLAFQPHLWAAGVDIVGIANLVTFLQNTSSYRRKIRESEYGSLETDADLLWELSPIRKVDDISAPLLIIHGANDPRVPLSEAELIHTKLTEQGKPSTLMVYDDEGHGLRKLKNRLDAYPKVVQFLKAALV